MAKRNTKTPDTNIPTLMTPPVLPPARPNTLAEERNLSETKEINLGGQKAHEKYEEEIKKGSTIFEEPNSTLDDLLDFDENSPPEIGTQSKVLDNDKVHLVLNELARLHQIQPPSAGRALAELFGKGAANKGAPNSLEVIVLTNSRQIACITKKSLLEAMGNIGLDPDHLRPLAKALAIPMGKYATKLWYCSKRLIPGDLATTIDRRLFQQKKPPLTNL